MLTVPRVLNMVASEGKSREVTMLYTAKEDTEIVWAKSGRGVWGLANVFADGQLYFTRDVPEAKRLPQGLEPPAKPPAKPAPKLPNLVPNPQPRVQPNLLPRWQPSLQLESPFLWPLLSMCSSSESNAPARKSGTQSLFLSRAEHASQQAVPGSFCGLPACFLSCRASVA